MTKRERIAAKMKAINARIDILRKQNEELYCQNLMLSDKKRQYKEEIEVHGKGKNAKEYLIGRIHWKDRFEDEDTGQVVLVERSRAVKQDGEWL